MNRRRAFRRRFSGGTKKAPLRLTWVTTLFNTGMQPNASVFNGQSLLDATDWGADVVASLNKPAFIRRIIVSFGYTTQVDATANSQSDGAVIHAMWKQDVDEDDTVINTTAVTTILTTERLLYTGIQPFDIISSTDQPDNLHWSPVHKIDWKGRLRINPDEVLVLGHQLLATMDTDMSTLTARTFSRVLIEEP